MGRFQEVERIVDLLLNSDLPAFIGDAGDDASGRAAKHRAEAVAGLLCGINAALNSKDAQVYADLIDRPCTRGGSPRYKLDAKKLPFL